MIKITGIIIGAVLISLIAPIVAQLPSETVNANLEAVEQHSSTPIINSINPVYVWGSQPVIDLSGVNSAIFRNGAFSKDPGGMSSGSLYTASINSFLKGDQEAGASRVIKKGAKIGLVHWP
jgi:hypothetical protein